MGRREYQSEFRRRVLDVTVLGQKVHGARGRFAQTHDGDMRTVLTTLLLGHDFAGQIRAPWARWRKRELRSLSPGVSAKAGQGRRCLWAHGRGQLQPS